MGRPIGAQLRSSWLKWNRRTMADILIFGVGEAARLATLYFEDQGQHRIAAYAVDAEHLTGERFQGREVVALENVEVHYPPAQLQCFVALGFRQMNGLRE